MPSLFYHNREIGRGVPDVVSERFSPELRAMSRTGQGCRDPGESTNCAVQCQVGAHSLKTRATSLVEAIANVVTGFLVAWLGQQILLPLIAIRVQLTAHCGMATLFMLGRQRLERRLPGGSC